MQLNLIKFVSNLVMFLHQTDFLYEIFQEGKNIGRKNRSTRVEILSWRELGPNQEKPGPNLGIEAGPNRK